MSTISTWVASSLVSRVALREMGVGGVSGFVSAAAIGVENEVEEEEEEEDTR